MIISRWTKSTPKDPWSENDFIHCNSYVFVYYINPNDLFRVKNLIMWILIVAKIVNNHIYAGIR